MGQFLIDNNALSNFFSGQFSEIGMNFMAEVLDQSPLISVVTEIEALSWICPDKNKELIIKSFIQDATVLALSPIVVEQCVKIRRSRKIKTPDAILIATALTHRLTLVTSDNDFNGIPELKIIDPKKL